MLSAQLHHKVPIEFEGMEDVLTSSVFALLRYLPPDLACLLLTNWADIPLQQAAPEVRSWPRHSTPAGFGVFLDATEHEQPLDRGDSEPDVIVRTEEWLVLVEVKYRSHLDEAYDQLGREFAIGYHLAGMERRCFRLLVVTANVLPPRPAGVDLASGVQRALRTVRAAGGAVTEEMIASVPDALRWVGWQQVYTTLSQESWRPNVAEHCGRLLEDTRQLLELRGLKPYGSQPLADAMRQWRSSGIPDEAWGLPIPYRYRTTASLAAGWRALLRLDATDLHPLAWRLELPSSRYDPLAHLADFRLDALQTSAWQPYP
jgi:hypothetical protein